MFSQDLRSRKQLWRAYKFCGWLGVWGEFNQVQAHEVHAGLGEDSERGLTSGQLEVWFWLLYLDDEEVNCELFEGGKEIVKYLKAVTK